MSNKLVFLIACVLIFLLTGLILCLTTISIATGICFILAGVGLAIYGFLKTYRCQHCKSRFFENEMKSGYNGSRTDFCEKCPVCGYFIREI